MTIERCDSYDGVEVEQIDRDGYVEFNVKDGFALVKEAELTALETRFEAGQNGLDCLRAYLEQLPNTQVFSGLINIWFAEFEGKSLGSPGLTSPLPRRYTLLDLFTGPETYEAYRTVFKKVAGSYGFDLPPWERLPAFARQGFVHLAEWANRKVEALLNHMLKEAA